MVDWKLKVSETDPLEVEGHSEISVEIRVRESGFWYMEASQRIQDREERAVLLEAETQYNWEFEPGAKNVLKWWRDLPKKKYYSILLSSDFCGLIFAFFSVITDFWSAAGEVGPVAFHGKQITSSGSLIFCFLKSRAILGFVHTMEKYLWFLHFPWKLPHTLDIETCAMWRWFAQHQSYLAGEKQNKQRLGSQKLLDEYFMVSYLHTRTSISIVLTMFGCQHLV